MTEARVASSHHDHRCVVGDVDEVVSPLVYCRVAAPDRAVLHCVSESCAFLSMTWADVADAVVGIRPRKVLQAVLVVAVLAFGTSGVSRAVMWYAEQRADQVTDMFAPILDDLASPPAPSAPKE